MRIISQNGLLDMPYELIGISPYSGNMATIVGTFPGNDLGKGDIHTFCYAHWIHLCSNLL